MTEQERYTIEKDFINEKLCIWDYDDLICEIDDDKTLIKLINILNKQNKIINKLTELKDKYSHSMLDVEEVNETLRKENEELKKENEWLKKEWDYWAEVNRQLIKKNNELEYRMDKLKKENEAQKDTIEAMEEMM